MNTPDPIKCLSDEELGRYVAESLDTHDDARVAQHVDECGSCRDRMTGQVAGAGSWQSAAGPLRDLDQNRREDDAARCHERELVRLQEYLTPSDDPTKLGRLGHYEVCGLIGSGSMGMVVKAFEPQLNRYVAIKVLSPLFASNGPARVRFRREARAIAAVNHEHVVPVHTVDDDGELPFLVMQYAAGGSLEQRILQSGPVSGCEVVRIGMQIARGLAEAHAQGIVHRDVKPANVMLESGVDRAMVTDFGLARVADDAAQTRSGVIAGTPQFMSPEQARGETVDPRSDLFSLGATLYAACTGRPPFRADSVFGVLRKVCESTPRPIRDLNASIEPWLAAFIDRLLQKAPGDRFHSAAQVADLLAAELAHLQNPTIIPRPRRAWWAAASNRPTRVRIATAAAALAVVATGACFARLGDPNPPSAHRAGALAPLAHSDRGALGGSRLALGGVLPVQWSPRPADDEGAVRARPAGFAPDQPADLGRAGEFVATRKSYPGGIVDGYALYLPRSYNDTTKRYPVLLFLGGGCQVGGEVSQAMCGALPDEIRSANRKIAELESIIEGGNVPLAEHYRLLVDEFIVVSPHMKGGAFIERQFFDQAAAIKQLLDEIQAGCRTDSTRTYVAGGGRGGHGALGLASRMPERFAATIAIRGRTFGVEDYDALATMPLWLGHCTEDTQVEFRESTDLISKLESDGTSFLRIGTLEAGGTDYMRHDRVFTSYAGEDFPNLFEHPQVLRWLLRFRKAPPPAAKPVPSDARTPRPKNVRDT